jgi:molybdate transport system regulatory protein
MGMSYKKAWAMVDELNNRGQKPYVITQKGGQKGGGTQVTKTGIQVLEAYQKLNKQLFSISKQHLHILKMI